MEQEFTFDPIPDEDEVPISLPPESEHEGFETDDDAGADDDDEQWEE